MRDIPGHPAARTGSENGFLTAGKRFGRSARFAVRGIRRTWATQPNFRIEVGVAVLALTLSLWLRTGTVAVLLATALVLAAELINTAIEALVDLVSPSRHRLAAAAKDAAAGAVLLCALISVLIGFFALAPAFFERLGLL